jgi:hypothetical protein
MHFSEKYSAHSLQYVCIFICARFALGHDRARFVSYDFSCFIDSIKIKHELVTLMPLMPKYLRRFASMFHIVTVQFSGPA